MLAVNVTLDHSCTKRPRMCISLRNKFVFYPHTNQDKIEDSHFISIHKLYTTSVHVPRSCHVVSCYELQSLEAPDLWKKQDEITHSLSIIKHEMSEIQYPSPNTGYTLECHSCRCSRSWRMLESTGNGVWFPTAVVTLIKTYSKLHFHSANIQTHH
jgi:hypothetical protein